MREQCVGYGKNYVVSVGDKTAERALSNEVRIVIEREEDIDRAGTYRQRRNQPAYQWPGTLGSDRGREQKRGGDDHFDDERECEIKIGGHF